MRWVLLLAIAVIVIALLRPKLRVGAPGRGTVERRDELVKDPVCQTYVVMSRAVRSEAGGATVHFCSRECADRYARGERRA
jgi:YHS domain-containing protein